MNILCTGESCPIYLASRCVFYEGDTLVYTSINNNDSLTVALEKIDAAIGAGGGGGGTWGTITGVITDQIDLINYLSSNYYSVTNPDDYLNLSNLIGGTGISITGTYPNITISAIGAGTVTSFNFIDTSEISGIVINSTTAPALTLTLLTIDGGIF